MPLQGIADLNVEKLQAHVMTRKLAKAIEQRAQFRTFGRKGILGAGRIGGQIIFLNKAVLLENPQPVGQYMVANVLEVLAQAGETYISLLDAEENVGHPALAQQVQQLVEYTAVFEKSLVLIIGGC